MFDHIGLHVENLDRSVAFYTAALAPLGHVLCAHDASGAGFGPKDQPGFWLYPSKNQGRPIHVALRATSRAMVEKFHAAGIAAGGKDNGAAGLRKSYADNYFAAFLIDPDGNNVEAVYFD